MILDEDFSNLVLREDNPYARGIIVDYGGGEYLLEREPLQLTPSAGDRYYTTLEGERPHNIAAEGYNNSKFYWILFDTNEFDTPFEIPEASTVVVPDLQRIKLNDL